MISTNECRRAYRRPGLRGLGEGEAAAGTASLSTGTTAGINILAALAPIGYALYKDRKDSKDQKSADKKDRAHEAAMQAEALKLAQAQEAAAAMNARLAAVQASEAQAGIAKWVTYLVGGAAILGVTVVGYKLMSRGS